MKITIDSSANIPVYVSYESDATIRLQCAMHVHFLITIALAAPTVVPTVREKVILNMTVLETTLTQVLQRSTTVKLKKHRKEVHLRTKTDMDYIAKYEIIM